MWDEARAPFFTWRPEHGQVVFAERIEPVLTPWEELMAEEEVKGRGEITPQDDRDREKQDIPPAGSWFGIEQMMAGALWFYCGFISCLVMFLLFLVFA